VNRSTNEREGASAFPLKVRVMEDGRAKATCVSLPGKEWFAASEESAIRVARNAIEHEFSKDGIQQTPKWAAEFGATPVNNDPGAWLKD
jgi:hypothetical protein